MTAAGGSGNWNWITAMNLRPAHGQHSACSHSGSGPQHVSKKLTLKCQSGIKTQAMHCFSTASWCENVAQRHYKRLTWADVGRALVAIATAYTGFHKEFRPAPCVETVYKFENCAVKLSKPNLITYCFL
jgi:hypothetical protein